MNQAQKKYYEKNKRKMETLRKISPVWYHKVIQEQGQGCAICATREKKLIPDFVAEKDDVYGLLCPDCLKGVEGLKHDEGLLFLAIDYLKRNTKN